MGSRVSRHRAARHAAAADTTRQQPTQQQQAPPKPTTSSSETAARAQEVFTTVVKKRFRTRALGSKQRRVEISGKADRYPYWMSTHSLQKHSGDHQKNNQPHQELKYYLLEPDGGEQAVGGGSIPMYLQQQLHTTMRLQLRFKDSNMSLFKQDSNPEHTKLKRCVRALLLKISVDKRVTPESKMRLDIKLYEQHFRARKKPQLRPMISDEYFYDTGGNLAVMGKEFLLIINKPKLTDRVDVLQGTYLRSLDTTLHGIITYTYTQNGTCSSSVQLPNSEEYYDEYAKLLLSKSSKELFTIKLPK